jgi:hypothetical protein
LSGESQEGRQLLSRHRGTLSFGCPKTITDTTMTLFELAALCIVIAAQVGLGWVAAQAHPALYYPTVAVLMSLVTWLMFRPNRGEDKESLSAAVLPSAMLVAAALSTAFAVRYASRFGVGAVIVALLAAPMLIVTLVGMVSAILGPVFRRKRPPDKPHA